MQTTGKISEVYPDFYKYLVVEGYSPQTIEKHRYFGRRAIIPAIGNKQIAELTLLDLAHIKEEVGKNFTGNITYSQRRALISFRRFMRFVQESGTPTQFNWRDIPFPKRPNKEATSLTEKEIAHIYGHLDTDDFCGLRMKLLFELLLKAGLRISEAIAIRIGDIDFENEELQVRNVKTNDYNTLCIPGLTPLLERYLDMRSDSLPQLFVTDGNYGEVKPIDMQGMKSALRRFRKKLKLRKTLTFHIWRRTFCSMLLQSGIDIRSVQYLARHAAPSTTLRYYVSLNHSKAREQHRKVMRSPLEQKENVFSTVEH